MLGRVRVLAANRCPLVARNRVHAPRLVDIREHRQTDNCTMYIFRIL